MIINFSNLGGGGGSSVQVIDNLQSTSSTAALSAKQGKVLNEAKADTTAVTESIGNALTAYTPTSGFTTINGSAITEGGNMVISADSTKIEKITTLPSSPIDGAVYNYNGVLIKYVNGAGEWGKWVTMANAFGADNKTSKSFNILTYPTSIPASMDGQILYKGNVNGSTGSNDVTFKFDLQNNRIGVLTATTSTEYDMYVEKDGAEVSVPFNIYTSQNLLVSWSGNVIKFSQQNQGSSYARWYSNGQCPVSTSTAHYEFLNPVDTRKYLTKNGGHKTALFDSEGNATPGMDVGRAAFKINDSYKYYIKQGSDVVFPNFYVPTSSGATGSLLVSQGNAEPQWKTTVQALGVNFWTGTQDEYDAIATKSATTLYIIIPDE